MTRLPILLMIAALPAPPAGANDTMATLGAGGLKFLNSINVRMVSEDLYISPTAVRGEVGGGSPGLGSGSTVKLTVAMPLKVVPS